MKPKKSKCIINTISRSGMGTLREVEEKLGNVRSNYKIAKWKEGEKKGQEMIYLSYC